MFVKLSEETLSKTKNNGSGNQEFMFSLKQYSFKDEQVIMILHFLQKGGKLKLSEV